MLELLVLIIISMLVGGTVVKEQGMEGLSLIILGIFILIFFYGEIFGKVISGLGISAILVFWLAKKNNSTNHPHLDGAKNKNQKNNYGDNGDWVKDIIKNAQAKVKKDNEKAKIDKS